MPEPRLGAAAEKTKAALDIARAKAASRYLKPTDMPIEIPESGARIYVLGPPYDEKAIKHFNPSKRNPEVYELALDGSGILAAGVFTALALGEDVRPFAALSSIPMQSAQAMPFFQNSYWGTPGDASEWRRIDSDWLGGTDELALMLQSATNNTSLVLAIELEDGDVMLFAGDAQVGNWLSWQNLTWTLPSPRHGRGADAPACRAGGRQRAVPAPNSKRYGASQTVMFQRDMVDVFSMGRTEWAAIDGAT